MREDERGVDHYVIAEGEGSLSTWRKRRAIRMGAGLRDEGSLSARGKLSVGLGALLLDFGCGQKRDIRVGGSSISPQIVFPRLGGA